MEVILSDFTEVMKLFDRQIITERNESQIFLREKDTSASLKQVQITCKEDLPYLRLKFPVKLDFSPFLVGRWDHNKRCDYVLYFRFCGSNWLLFIEVKSSLPNQSGTKPKEIIQLTSTKCFIEYCSCLLDELYNISDWKNCNKRFIVFAGNIRKRTTKPKIDKSLHDNPENPLFVEYEKPVQLDDIMMRLINRQSIGK